MLTINVVAQGIIQHRLKLASLTLGNPTESQQHIQCGLGGKLLEFERTGLRKPLPRQVAPDEPTRPEVIQNLTVRDMVAVLRTDVQ